MLQSRHYAESPALDLQVVIDNYNSSLLKGYMNWFSFYLRIPRIITPMDATGPLAYTTAGLPHRGIPPSMVGSTRCCTMIWGISDKENIIFSVFSSQDFSENYNVTESWE